MLVDWKKSEDPPLSVLVSFFVNGEQVQVAFSPHKTLLEVLREDLRLTGTKHGCELGECGTCAVLVDGKPVLSCLSLGLECEGKRVETVEGMAGPEGLHPLQKAFADLGAAQCGYCTPGILLTAKALLTEHPKPTLTEIKEALAGNLCRCTGYIKIFEAVELAAAWMRGEEASPRHESLYGADFDESGLSAAAFASRTAAERVQHGSQAPGGDPARGFVEESSRVFPRSLPVLPRR